MNKTQEKCFFETVRELAEVSGLDTFREVVPMVKQLHRYDRTLHRLAELECNGYPKMKVEYRDGKMFRFEVEDEDLRRKSEKKEERIKLRAQFVASQLKVGIEFGGDPRGAVMRLLLPSKQSNSWGGGWVLDLLLGDEYVVLRDGIEVMRGKTEDVRSKLESLTGAI